MQIAGFEGLGASELFLALASQPIKSKDSGKLLLSLQPAPPSLGFRAAGDGEDLIFKAQGQESIIWKVSVQSHRPLWLYLSEIPQSHPSLQLLSKSI